MTHPPGFEGSLQPSHVVCITRTPGSVLIWPPPVLDTLPLSLSLSLSLSRSLVSWSPKSTPPPLYSMSKTPEYLPLRDDEEVQAPQPPNPVLLACGPFSVSLPSLQYYAFLLVGMAQLWPWNCLLSASGYFITKFGADSSLGKNYSSTMMTVSTLSSLCMNSYLSTQQFAKFELRVVRGASLNVVVFTVLALMELMDPAQHSAVYFVMLMLLVVSSSLGTSLTQNGSMALANVQGPEYAQAVMVGQAVAGVLPSLSLLISELVYAGREERGSTTIVLYFATTSAVTLLAGAVFHISHRVDTPVILEEEESEYVPFMTLFQQLRYVVMTIVTSFVVTLVFPIFASNTTSVHKDWRLLDDAIFIPLAFLIWNIGDLMGRVLCGFAPLVIKSDIAIFIYSIARILFLPVLLLCNVDSTEKPWIDSDTIYLTLQLLFGATNGHCLSCAFMAVPLYVPENQRGAAGGFTTVFLSLGLLLGSVFSFLFVPLVG